MKQVKHASDVPQGPHYQILVMGSYYERVDYGPPDPPETVAREKVDVFVTEVKEEWISHLNKLYQEKPNRTDVVAQIVQEVAEVNVGISVTYKIR